MLVIRQIKYPGRSVQSQILFYFSVNVLFRRKTKSSTV